ncbi:MAG TPA: hypothetical protein DIU15_09705 [Deltaproteobacteria bacterium]|nr:hypothetical protein [Deltaproteobacteria bacterium]HCP46306.1 hypothetical protein [Deltaproteobacteria bacterium]
MSSHRPTDDDRSPGDTPLDNDAADGSTQPSESTVSPSRRGLLRASAALGGLALAGAAVSRTGAGGGLSRRRFDHRPAPETDPPFVTPTEHFYSFSNGAPPEPIPLDSAMLRVGSEISPKAVPWRDLVSLATQRVHMTLQCDGSGYHEAEGGGPPAGCQQVQPDEDSSHPPPENWDWRFGGVGNAVWDVVPVAELYGALGIELTGPWIRAVGRDGFARNLPVDLARMRDFSVAVGMNGEPLPDKHGAPGRLLVPGQYGMMSVKWLRELTTGELLDARVFDGGPLPHYPVKPLAWATFPGQGERVSSERVEARGIAFAGEHPVKEVLLWVNPAEIWTAELVDTPSPHVWCRWKATIEVPRGSHQLHIACVDTRGQHSREQEPWGDAEGYGGFHVVDIVAT